MKLKELSILAVVTALAPASLHAQVTQAPGVVDRNVPSFELPKSFSLDEKAVGSVSGKPRIEGGDRKKIIATISKVKFSELAGIAESELQAIVSPYLNKGITEFDLAKLKFEIRSHFYESGVTLVKVTTPPQDLASGILHVDVYAAKIGDLTVTNSGILANTIVGAFKKRVSSDDVFEETSVESMVTDFSGLSGIGATLNLKKSAQFGRTDLNVTLFDENESVQSVNVDNYGSPLTGEVVFTGHLEVNNFAHLGEKIFTDVRRSNGDLWSAAVGAEAPIGIRNIKLNVNVLHSENEIGDRLAFQQASGESDIFTTSLSSDIINVAKKRLTFSSGLEARRHESFSELGGAKVTTSEDAIRQIFASVTYLQREDTMVFYGSARVDRGVKIFGADDAGVGRSDPLASPEAWRFQPVFLTNVLSPFSDGTFQALATGQFASSALLSSNLFSIGGYGSVRGFDPAQETGESGYAFSLEYLHNLPEIAGLGVKLGPFFDGGAVYNRNVSSIDSHLYSAGLVLELVADIIPSAKSTTLRIDWANPIGNYRSTLVDDSQVFFRLSQEF